MKKIVCAVLMAAILLAGMGAYASGFSQDPDRIEQAAKSVLMLEMYNRQGELFARASAFVAFDNGMLVTNYHVIAIEDVSKILAISDDFGTHAVTKVFCADKNADIAILGLKFKTPLLEPLPLWAEENPKRGMPVVAIGSPVGWLNTVSMGHISGVFEDGDTPMLQFTAPISRGSSGGALLNDDGKVIGVTTGSIMGEDVQNVNYAVDIAAVKAMYQAWDGSVYTLTDYKNTARLNYTGVYDHAPEASAESWSCPDCGNENDTPFCPQCGKQKPDWTCACGQVNQGSFCGSCGAARTEP